MEALSLGGLRRAGARVLIAAVLLAACVDLVARNLDELVVQDSTYYDPATQEPYTGPVFKRFDTDPSVVQLRARLEHGTFTGELTVYHASGRVRFQGQMVEGRQCGGWLENEDDSEAESEVEAVKRELESIVIYPACP